MPMYVCVPAKLAHKHTKGTFACERFRLKQHGIFLVYCVIYQLHWQMMANSLG